MSPELIALTMFAAMLVLLLTGQRVFGAIGFVGAVAALLLWGTGGQEMPFNQAFKLMNWYPLLTLPDVHLHGLHLLREPASPTTSTAMFHVWFGAGARRARHRHHRADGGDLGDERPLGRRHGDRRHHRAAGAAAARLRQDHGHRRGPGRLDARHPDPALGGAGALRA